MTNKIENSFGVSPAAITDPFCALLGSSIDILNRTRNEGDIHEGILNVLKESGLFNLIFIGTALKDGKFKYIASFGHANRSVEPSLAVRAWKEKKPHFINIPSSAAAFPIFKGNNICSVLVVSGEQPGLFDMRAMGMMVTLAKLMGNSLSRFDLEKEKMKFEKYKKTTYKKIRHLSHIDTLTKLRNREMFEANIKKVQFKAEKNKKITYVIVLDLDDLKRINDKYGELAGDDVLTLFAKRLVDFSRNNNNIFKREKKGALIPVPPSRLGGDEFGITVLIDDDPKNAGITAFCKSLHEELSKPATIENNIENLNSSMGIAACRGSVYGLFTEPNTLIRMANQALYRSKSMGKNTINFFDRREESNIISFYQKIREIKEALKSHEFFLYYQPKVNLKTGEIMGFESLLRRITAEGNIIPPSEFIPIAEESDLIVDIGDFVIDQTLSQLSKWVEEGLGLPVSINISVKQLMKPDFIGKIDAILARNPNVPTNLIHLEITETAILEDLEYLKNVMKKCKEKGISFVIDDCGSGYSSLIYLKELPFDIVKIDMAFIRNMLVNKSDMLMVQSLLSLSKIMGKEIIAEGVETMEQGIILNMLGCNNVQGYYTGRPISSEMVSGWIKNFSLSKKLSSWKNVKLNIGDFGDFLIILAYVGHNEFVEKIKKMCLEEKILLKDQERKKLKDFKSCDFGEWYYGEGLKYKNMESYKNLKNYHEKTHEAALRALDFCLEKKYEEAGPILKIIEDLTEKIQTNLLNLARDVSKNSRNKITSER